MDEHVSVIEQHTEQSLVLGPPALIEASIQPCITNFSPGFPGW